MHQIEKRLRWHRWAVFVGLADVVQQTLRTLGNTMMRSEDGVGLGLLGL